MNQQPRTRPAPDAAPAASAAGLVKRFNGQTVLDGVNLDVRAGETLVIIGGSGCGKSTLLRCMIGSVWPDAGRVELFGQDIAALSEREMDALRKRMGVLFQSGALFNSMTVGQNVALPLKEHTSLDDATIDIMVSIKLELVGLRKAVDKMPAELSGGMKKRAGLARAIALDPEILFYDEPSAGLDPVTSAEIDRLIMDLAGKVGVTSVVVTHEMDSAFRIADRMAMMDCGRMLKIGPRAEFEAIRGGPQTGDETHDLIRQFLRGESDGPITKRRHETDFGEDILEIANR
jgi:phospholipid/cholesterol/gamma-HCH transport system ATP-binding protein